MELSEAYQRIVKRHALLIGFLVVVGLLVPFVLHLSDPTLYLATSRLVLDTEDPANSEQSTAIADTARAIATSRIHVLAALKEAGVRRDPTIFAEENVSVDALGSSGILLLSVTDRLPKAAADVANVLAQETIDTRLETQVPQAVTELDARIRSASERIQSLNEQITQTPGDPTLVQQRDDLVRQKSGLEAQRFMLLEAELQHPSAAIIDAATPPEEPAPTSRNTDMALGALIGLMAGIASASVIEVLNPSVVGREAVVRVLGAPVLGHLPAPFAKLHTVDVTPVVTRVLLAAAKANVNYVSLVSISLDGDLGRLASRLNEALPDLRHENRLHRPALASAGPDANAETNPGDEMWVPASASRPAGQRHGGDEGEAESVAAQTMISAFDGGSIPEEAALHARASGFVAVLPSVFKRSELEPLLDLIAVGGPLIGVITYRTNGPLKRR
jgi:capsular polysaccharide biosynthesis protein